MALTKTKRIAYLEGVIAQINQITKNVSNTEGINISQASRKLLREVIKTTDCIVRDARLRKEVAQNADKKTV